MSKKQRGLGRGLSALMEDINAEMPDSKADVSNNVRNGDKVAIELVVPNPDQPRKQFDGALLRDLAQSIAERGMIQPILVRADPNSSGRYQIVAGERRWRAAQIAKLHEVPILIRDMDDREILEVAIIENVQRADLNPVEEARGYRALMDNFGHTQEQVGEALGKSRSYIANLLRLLSLPQTVLSFLQEGKLSIGHARALITAENAEAIAREVIAKDLNVRQTEALAKSGLKTKPRSSAKPQKDSDTRAIESDLSANLGMKVSIDHKPNGEAGNLVVSYNNLDELEALCAALTAMNLGGSK